jgi:hypothetical protein
MSMPKTVTINEQDLRDALASWLSWLEEHPEMKMNLWSSAQVVERLWSELQRQPVQV